MSAAHRARRRDIDGRYHVRRGAKLRFILLITLLVIFILLIEQTLLPIVYKKSHVSAAEIIFSSPIKINDNVNEPTDQTNPKGIMMSNGKIFVAWRDDRNANSKVYSDIYASISNEAITNFSLNEKINRRNSSCNADRPLSLAVATVKNNVYVVWEDNTYMTTNHHILFSKSTDGGKTFGPHVKVDDLPWNENNQRRPVITVANDGTVIVAWINEIITSNSTRITRVRLAIYDPINNTFSKNFELPNYFSATSSQDYVSLAANRNYVYVAYIDNWLGRPHPYVTWSTDSLRSFAPKRPVRLDICNNPNASQSELVIAPFSKGSIIAVWTDNRNGDEDIYGTLLHKYHDVLGENFRIDDGPVGTKQRNPTVVMDRNNGIYVAWSDNRYYHSSADTWGIRFSYGKFENPSVTFSASVSVYSPAQEEKQHSPSISTNGAGNIYIAFARCADKGIDQADVYLSSGVVSSADSVVSSAILSSTLFSCSIIQASLNFAIEANPIQKMVNNFRRLSAQAFKRRYSLPTAVSAASGTALILR